MHADFVTHVRTGLVPPDHVRGSGARLAEIEVPVLGIVGALDSPDHQRMCAEAVAAVPDGRGVVTSEGAGHFPHLERPAAWARAVDGFLADVTGSGTGPRT